MPNITNAEILITGGAGFIGSTLAEALVKQGAKVTIIDAMIAPYGGNIFNIQSIKRKINFIHGDIRSKRLLRKLVEGKDFIYHLAGQTGRTISMEQPLLDASINIDGTLNVLDAMKKVNRKGKVIFASSRGVVGEPEYFPVDEKHPLRPKDVYGANKLVAEQYCLLYGREYGLRTTILRFNNIYGPRCQIRSNHYGTINLFIAYALQGKVLPVYGNGLQTRDYVYVTDAVSALSKALHKKADEQIFFVASNKEVSLLDIISSINKYIITTRYNLIPYPEKFGKIDFNRFFCSFDKINKTLDWSPKISIDNGIKKTIEYYKKNLKNYL